MSEKETTPSVPYQALKHPKLLIWFLDDQLCIKTYNPTFAYWMLQVYGVEVAEGSNILELSYVNHGEDIGFWREQYHRVLETKEYWQFQTSLLVDGEEEEVAVELFPDRVDGKVVGILCYARNVTEEERAKAQMEQQLIETNRQLQNMLEYTQDMIFSLNKDLAYTGFNQKHRRTMEELFGGVPKKGVGIFDCVPSYAESVAPYAQEVLQEGKLLSKELSYGKGLTRCYFDTSLHPIFNKAGKLEGVSVFVRDTTARRKAEQQAQKGIKLFSSINKNLTESIFRSTPNNRIKYVNQAFLNMFGMPSRAQALAKPAQELYKNPEDRRRVLKELEEQGRVHNWEIEFLKADGSIFIGLLSCTRSTSEKDEVFFDGAIRDITELKQARVAVEESNKELRSINSALDQFVYTASHDLKAPLRSISGLLKIFRMDKDETRRDQYLEKIEHSVTKLESFISDIVDYSRNSRQALKIEEVDIDQTIKDLVEEVRYMPNARRVHIEYEGAVSSLRTDKARLEAIIRNLVSNAVTYADLEKEKPNVSIRSELHDGKHLVFTVSDNGLGIEDKHLSKIFEMFYRASEGGNGSGIGLFIVKEALEKLKGEVNVDSTPKQGTTFSVKIPIRQS